jgi:DNA primase
VNLHDVLKQNNIELLPSSQGRWVAVCPFHKGDRDPSFTIYPTGTYFCFGCQEWGDAVKFLVDYKGMTDKEAREFLGEDFKFPKADKNVVLKVQDATRTYKFLYECAQAYHEYALESQGPLSYLERRGVSEVTAKRYMLGYSDGRVLKLRFAAEYAIGKQIGLISAEGYEAMSHRITIPNLVGDDLCDFIMGRTVTNDRVKYLGTRMPKPIFGFWEVRHSPIIFIAEGQFDWLLLRQNDYPAAVLGGTHITRANRTLLRGKKIVIVPDNDAPGLGAAQSLKQQLGEDAMILDYSSLGVKDIGELEGDPVLWERFEQLVLEQVSWLTTSISKIALKAFLPTLESTMSLHLT